MLLSIVECIGALGLLSSGHLVQVMVAIRGPHGELFEGRIKGRVQSGTGQAGGILEQQEANISDHRLPFLVCFGKSNLHFPAFPPQSLWIWVCELYMNLAQVPTVFSSSQ